MIVTGASSGIGLDIATHYARAGAFVTIVARNATKLEEARAQITTVAEGSHVLAVCADVTIPEEAEGSVRRTVEK